MHNWRRHIVERAADMLGDPRLPQAALRVLWRRVRYAASYRRSRIASLPLQVCLTFDVEHDYRNPRSLAASQAFLPIFLQWADRYGWRTTLFVQGNLVASLAPLLHDTQPTHELGLHGLEHEVWGPSRWWQYRLGLQSLPLEEKDRRLALAVQYFQDAGLPIPSGFRAPYLNIDRATLQLLERHGFLLDASPPSYQGSWPVPHRWGSLWQVPVTAHPRPQIACRGWAWFRYPDLSMGTLLKLTDAEFLDLVESALWAQRLAGYPLGPHLVFLGHPWEFDSYPGVRHGSQDNWRHLMHRLRLLEAQHSVRYATMADLLRSPPAALPAGRQNASWLI